MAPTDPRPIRIPQNIIVIVLDDVGVDKLGSFDDGQVAPPYARTPRLDALADGGIRFTNAHANPICSPTRACIQTGRYPFRNGMAGNSVVYTLPDSEILLARLLKEGLPARQAYSCGAFGKWHLTGQDLSNSSNLTHAVRNGFDRFFGTLGNDPDHFHWTKVEYDHAWAQPRVIPISGVWSAEVVRVDAVNWINSRPLQRPFFAYVAFNPPHDRFQVPPFATQDGRPLLSSQTRSELGTAQPGDSAANPLQNDPFFRASLEAVDSEIGYLLADIQRPDPTMVFVVGDNGTPSAVINSPHDPDHGKMTFYQHGTHVPLIVSGPLVGRPIPQGGHACSAMIDAVDIWSTIAGIAKAKLSEPPVVDGTSFLPLIKNPQAAGARPWSFSQLFSPSGPYASVVALASNGRSITNGIYNYIRTVSGHTPGDPTIDYTHQLYKTLDDPEETYDFVVNGMTAEATAAYEYLSTQMDMLSEFT